MGMPEKEKIPMLGVVFFIYKYDWQTTCFSRLPEFDEHSEWDRDISNNFSKIPPKDFTIYDITQ